jgi:coenzyme F420-reducing hydrogenase delta subunit
LYNNPDYEPKIIAYLCTWCSYAAADLAGSSRTQYPPNIRVVRVPCTGRLDPLLIIKAFNFGADGILISGCHPGDCHYLDGNLYARRRFVMLNELLKYAGVEAERLNFTWWSASEGKRFASVVEKTVKRVKSVGPWMGFTGQGFVEREDGLADEK